MNKKKLLALVLAALMSVSGLTVAFADGTDGSGSAAVVLENGDTEVAVTNADGLKSALEAGGKVVLKIH